MLWNHHNPFQIFAGTDSGLLSLIDVRQSDKPVYKFSAHTSALTSIILSPTMSSCLVTGSIDKSVKLWDIGMSEPSLVSERRCKIGSIYCGSVCPDETLVVCVGGEREMKILNLQTNSAFREHFMTTVKQTSSDVDSPTTGDSDIPIVTTTANSVQDTSTAVKKKKLKNKHLKKKKKSSH